MKTITDGEMRRYIILYSRLDRGQCCWCLQSCFLWRRFRQACGHDHHAKSWVVHVVVGHILNVLRTDRNFQGIAGFTWLNLPYLRWSSTIPTHSNTFPTLLSCMPPVSRERIRCSVLSVVIVATCVYWKLLQGEIKRTKPFYLDDFEYLKTLVPTEVLVIFAEVR
jgi:hypothetical protein